MELSNLGLKKAPSPLPWRLELSEKNAAWQTPQGATHDVPHIFYPEIILKSLRRPKEIKQVMVIGDSFITSTFQNLVFVSFWGVLEKTSSWFGVFFVFFLPCQKKKRHLPWHWKIRRCGKMPTSQGPKPNESQPPADHPLRYSLPVDLWSIGCVIAEAHRPPKKPHRPRSWGRSVKKMRQPQERSVLVKICVFLFFKGKVLGV